MKPELSKDNLMLKTGDLFFFCGNSILDAVIAAVTHGQIAHVGIIATANKTFEARGTAGKSTFFNIMDYFVKPVIIPDSNRVYVEDGWLEFYRLKALKDGERDYLRSLCEKYDGTPYSYWDCLTQLIFSPFPRGVRRAASSILGTKLFSKCDEMVMRLIYKATKWGHQPYMPFKDYEASNPSEMYKLVSKSASFYRINPFVGIVAGEMNDSGKKK